MEDRDKAIEIMKAAMEKEKEMKEQSFETLNEQIDPETDTLMNDSNIAASEEGDNLVEEDTEIDTDTMQNTEEVNDEESNAVDASGEKQEKSMKNFFKSNKNKEMTAKDQKIEELTDRLMRNMAEFDNFRKRSEKEKSQMYDIGAKSVIEKLLPIVDNFERGLGTVSEKEKGSAFAQGIELIYKQLVSALEEIGVKPIEAVGKEFDPALHNAVMHGEDENLGENIISDEFQKGYLYRDIVVRHSMVKVVN